MRSFGFDIFKPFSCYVWMMYLVLIVVFGSLARITFKYEAITLHSVCTFLMAFGAFCQQGIYGNVSLVSSRTLIACMLFSSLLIYNYYTSTLVSTLVETKHETNIKTLNDLIDSDLPVGFLNSTAVHFLLNVRELIYDEQLLTSFPYFRQPKRRDWIDFWRRKFGIREKLSIRIFIIPRLDLSV